MQYNWGAPIKHSFHWITWANMTRSYHELDFMVLWTDALIVCYNFCIKLIVIQPLVSVFTVGILKQKKVCGQKKKSNSCGIGKYIRRLSDKVSQTPIVQEPLTFTERPFTCATNQLQSVVCNLQESGKCVFHVMHRGKIIVKYGSGWWLGSAG